eukprot:Gb_16692 [translate_table: standard]
MFFLTVIEKNSGENDQGVIRCFKYWLRLVKWTCVAKAMTLPSIVGSRDQVVHGCCSDDNGNPRMYIRMVSNINSGIVSSITTDPPQVQEAIGKKVGVFLHNIGTFTGGIIIGVISCWQIALLILGTLPLMTITSGIYGLVYRRLTIKGMSLYSHVGSVIQEILFVRGKIRFQNVTFYYPSHPNISIFSNLSFTIPAHKIMALLGSSGSGKDFGVITSFGFFTSLAATMNLCEILFDGEYIKTLNLRWYRMQVGWVSQEPILFCSSIRENILGWLPIFHSDLASLFIDNPVLRDVVYKLTILLAFTILLNSIQPVLIGVAVGSGWQTFIAYVNIGIWVGMIFRTAVQTIVLIFITWFWTCVSILLAIYSAAMVVIYNGNMEGYHSVMQLISLVLSIAVRQSFPENAPILGFIREVPSRKGRVQSLISEQTYSEYVVNSLKTFGLAGLNFIRKHAEEMVDEADNHTRLRKFDMVFPAMLNDVKSLGLDLLYELPIMKQIAHKREAKLKEITIDVLHSVPIALLPSLEGLQDLVLDCVKIKIYLFGATSSFVWTKGVTTSGSHLGFRPSEGLTVKMVLET